MKNNNSPNNIAILDIGKTHAKCILFDGNKMEELVIYQTKNNIINDDIYPHYDVDNLKKFFINSFQKISKNSLQCFNDNFNLNSNNDKLYKLLKD